MRVGVIGLGKLGCPFALWLASKNHVVSVHDSNPAIMAALDAGVAPVQEPGLQTAIDLHAGNLRLKRSILELVKDSVIIFIVVPTPSQPDGAFDLRHVVEVASSVGQALRATPIDSTQALEWKLVVVVSTVMPGDTKKIAAVLEETSGSKVGRIFGLCYNPEFIALGRVLQDLEHPDIILIGESDSMAGGVLDNFYSAIYNNPHDAFPPGVHRMGLVNAEVAKLALNCFITMKISFANMMARICDVTPDGDVDDVLEAVGADSRVGKKYLKAGTSFGGPCFPRDNAALLAYASQVGVQAPLPHATVEENALTAWRLITAIQAAMEANSVVGILGLAYKPDTAVTEQSVGVKLATHFKDRAICYDPVATIGSSVQTKAQVLSTADILVVCLPLDEFQDLSTARARYVVDPWRVVKKVGPGAVLYRIGVYDD